MYICRQTNRQKYTKLYTNIRPKHTFKNEEGYYLLKLPGRSVKIWQYGSIHSLVLISDGNSEHAVHAWRKSGIVGEKKPNL